jgi:2-amino-4-hydroxy-6-hydroxymethyldihydropteridine diphosphokinase
MGSARGGVRAYVGLGANLGAREETIRRAVDLLRAQPELDVVAVSTLRETEPWGPVAQPPFLNGAAAVVTTLEPRALLDVLLDVERRLGRVREERWGPRTIDLDLLLYGDAVVDEPGLTVPHPRLRERPFALEPLVELDPDLVVPGQGPVVALLDSLGPPDAP